MCKYLFDLHLFEIYQVKVGEIPGEKSYIPLIHSHHEESLGASGASHDNRDSVNCPERQVSSPPLHRVQGWTDSPELDSSKESSSVSPDFSDFKPCAFSTMPPFWNTLPY